VHVLRRRVLSMSNLMGGARRLDEGEQSPQDVKSPVSPATHCYEPQKSPLMRGPLSQTGSKWSDPKGESLHKLDYHKER
jgi:hypothetical protein